MGSGKLALPDLAAFNVRGTVNINVFEFGVVRLILSVNVCAVLLGSL
jgi:hypothetical protein